MKTKSITLGFRAAGVVNIAGVLLFSKGLTNAWLIDSSPVICSRFGLTVIMVWGLAYLSVARDFSQVPALVLVFALEKLVYVATWLVWMIPHGRDLPRIFTGSPLAATFYVVYGPNDLLFGLFFVLVARRSLGQQSPRTPELRKHE